jgi:transposase
VGVTEGAVSPWMTRAREGGPEALVHRPPPGPRRRLSAEPLTRLPALLARGAEASGCRGHVWTRGRLAVILRLACGLASHPGPSGRGLDAMRWRLQKPARRARQRDEAAMAHGRDQTWPALNKGRKPTGKPSSSSTNPDALPGPASSAPLRR